MTLNVCDGRMQRQSRFQNWMQAKILERVVVVTTVT